MNSQSTVFRAAWLLLNDKEFLRQNIAVNPNVFPRGGLRYLVKLAQAQWEKSHSALSSALVDMITEADAEGLNKEHITPGAARQAYDDLNAGFGLGSDELIGARQLCRRWLEDRQLRVALDRADIYSAAGKADKAEEALRGARLPSMERSSNVSMSPGVAPPLTMATPKKGAYPTGLVDLDRAWDGGYRRGELGMVVAPTGVGKTMALCVIGAEAFWRGASIMYYSYELTPSQIQDRMTAAILQKRPSQIGNDWDKELAIAARARGVPVPPKYDLAIRNSSMTWSSVTADIDEYKQLNGKYPDLLLLDSADDIAPLRARDGTHTELKEAFVYLRSEIAEGRRIRTWTSGQLNRESIDKARVSLKYIGDAFAKVQKSHYCLGFAQTDQDREDIDGPQLRIYVLKDSLHGTQGAFLKATAEWGHGKDGYPGLTVNHTEGL